MNVDGRNPWKLQDPHGKDLAIRDDGQHVGFGLRERVEAGSRSHGLDLVQWQGEATRRFRHVRRLQPASSSRRSRHPSEDALDGMGRRCQGLKRGYGPGCVPKEDDPHTEG